ncbi:MAG: FG-GAP repeat domain-containing protein [Fervidobacterium sp.]
MRLRLLSISLLIIVSTIFSIDWSKPNYSKTYPISNYDQSKPESALGCVYAKDISLRTVSDKLVAVIAYQINTITASPGSGPFTDVSQTFAVDYNKDGYADIVSITYGGKVVIKQNKGIINGNLQIEDYISYNLGIAGDGTFIVDDFDNDGKVDIFLYNAHYQAAYVPNAIQNTPKIYTKNVPYNLSDFLTNWTVSAMASYDFDGDGYKDIVYADMRGRVWLWKNNNSKGKDRFFNTQFIKLIDDPDIGTTASNGGAVLDVYDVNKDGVPDIIAGNTDKKNIFIYPGKIVNNQIVYDVNTKITLVKADGTLGNIATVDSSILNSKSPSTLPSFAPTIIKVTDVDRDGVPDVFVGTDAWRQGKNFGGSVYLFKGKNFTATGIPQFLSLELVHGSYSAENKPPYDFDAGTIGDLDNDGIPDFVAADGNHSGNYYKILTQTVNEYKLTDGIMVSDRLVNLVDYKYPDGNIVIGIPKLLLQNNFVRAFEVEVEFLESSVGYFELRYSKKLITDPSLIVPSNFPLMLDASTMQQMQTYMPIPLSKKFVARAILDTPSPDPQVIIVLKALSKTQAPHLTKVTYRIWTEPARVIIRGFNWTKER